jgi:hypothetical protein
VKGSPALTVKKPHEMGFSSSQVVEKTSSEEGELGQLSDVKGQGERKRSAPI